MNGVLWKWTNYYSGWQPRWFVLQDGVLSYYKSEDEVHCGSKGSINLMVCDVNVCNYDPTRFEIFVPGEQKYHLKASSTQERQRWIVALGSCKACHTELDNSVVSGLPSLSLHNSNKSSTESDVNYRLLMEEIHAKESEMRIFLDLINQNTRSIKENLQENHTPDMELINETTTTLNAACDTFIDSLKELMALATTNARFVLDPGISQQLVTQKSTSPVPVSHIQRRKGESLTGSELNFSETFIENGTQESQENVLSSVNERKVVRREINFFATMNSSFVDMMPKIEKNKDIETGAYILSFSSMITFLNNFTSTSIRSLKSDIASHLQRLTQKYESDKCKFGSINMILSNEAKTTPDLNVQSAVYAVRILNRTTAFVVEFLEHLKIWLDEITTNSTEDVVNQRLQLILTISYEQIVKPKLNWIDQGLFTVVMKSLPKLSEFIAALFDRMDSNEVIELSYITDDKIRKDQLIIDLVRYKNALICVHKIIADGLKSINVDI